MKLPTKTLKSIGDLRSPVTPDEIFDLNEAYQQHVVYAETEKRRAWGSSAGKFYVSSLGQCGRRMALSYLGTPRETQETAEGLDTLKLGNKIHDMLQDTILTLCSWLEAKFPGVKAVFKSEMRTIGMPRGDELYEAFRLTGRTDGLLEISNDSEGWVQRATIEFKSIKSERFKDLRGPVAEHRLQAHTYAFVWDTPIIYYFYFDKNTSQRKLFVETFDASLVDTEITDKVTTVLQYVAAGELPPREESFIGCTYCPFPTTCAPDILRHKAGVASKKLATTKSVLSSTSLVQKGAKKDATSKKSEPTSIE